MLQILVQAPLPRSVHHHFYIFYVFAQAVRGEMMVLDQEFREIGLKFHREIIERQLPAPGLLEFLQMVDGSGICFQGARDESFAGFWLNPASTQRSVAQLFEGANERFGFLVDPASGGRCGWSSWCAGPWCSTEPDRSSRIGKI